jgi:ribokinase
MPRRTISVLGGVVQDLTTIVNRLPDDGETVIANSFTMQAGGKGANSAVAIHRLTRPNPKNRPDDQKEAADDDIQVRMVGAVGADEFGPVVRQNLMNCGVAVDGVRIMEGQSTAVANILVEAGSGANRIMQYPGAAYALEPADFMTLESLGGGVAPDLVISQLEIRRDAIEQAIETADREGVEVLLNPSPASYVMTDIYPMVGHLVMNETEAVMLSLCEPEDIENQTGWTNVAEYFHNLGVKNVVITLGKKGAYYSNEFATGYVEAEKNCTVLDTSGAGCVPRRIATFPSPRPGFLPSRY